MIITSCKITEYEGKIIFYLQKISTTKNFHLICRNIGLSCINYYVLGVLQASTCSPSKFYINPDNDAVYPLRYR